MSDLLALALRCEAATGPDRKLDIAIWCAICPPGAEYDIDDWHKGNPVPPHNLSVGLSLHEWMDRFPDQTEGLAKTYGVPRYTASIDAAVTLVPEGYAYGLGSQDCRLKAWAWCGEKEMPASIAWKTMKEAAAATPALAMCAAALRARAASTPSLNAEIAGMNQGDSA